MTSVVSTERRGNVLLATMDDGRANAFAPHLVAGVRDAIATAEGDPDIGAVVVAGRPGRFSGGFDLDVIASGDRAAIRAMVNGGGELVRLAYGASVPVVAACTGHAVAAGALFLLGCDHRVGPTGDVKIGLNEVAIGLSLPGWAVTIAAERLARTALQRSVANAVLLDGAGAIAAGFLDRVVDPEVVVATAVEDAGRLATLDPAAYRTTVEHLRGPVMERMAGQLGLS